MLKHFAVDPKRHELVVDVEFYQMNLASVVARAKELDESLFVNDGIYLPSWSKFAADPVRGKGFFTYMLQAVFEGKGGDDSLNVDFQTKRKAREGRKVAMMFLPGSTTNDNLLEIKPIAEQALQGFKIVLVSGAAMVTGSTAERVVLEAIEDAQKNNQHVLILSAGMAQRSFSIAKLTELYLAYDSGDNGATIQKMSRAFTPDQVGKVGRVISLSFDPNRDDKFDAMIIETAQNYARNKGIKDLKKSLSDVIRTVDYFKCQPDGAVKIEVDSYLAEALERRSIDRVIGKVADLTVLSAEEISALATGKAAVFQAARQQAAEKGKTRSAPPKKGAPGESAITASAKEMAKAREVIVTIAQNIDIIRYYSGGTVEEAFDLMDTEGKIIQDEVTEQFGVDYGLIKELILGGVISRDLLDLKFA